MGYRILTTSKVTTALIDLVQSLRTSGHPDGEIRQLIHMGADAYVLSPALLHPSFVALMDALSAGGRPPEAVSEDLDLLLDQAMANPAP